VALVELSTRPAPWPASHIEIAFDEDIPDERLVRLETRMGAISLDRSRVVMLPDGMPGFMDARSFALVRLPGTRFDPFLLMQFVEDPTTSFLVLPLDVTTELYDPAHLEAAGRSLGIHDGDLGVLVIVNLRRNDGELIITVNLRAPLLIDLASLKAWQHIMESERYPIRFQL
jgi:flagellar assembly factor FliW